MNMQHQRKRFAVKPYQTLSESISPANEDLMVISHRGEWAMHPENSIEAMLLAAQTGADMVELDAQRTKSGLIYLMHDDTTDRMTNRSGATTSVTEDEFRSLLLREREGGPEADITTLPVPTLQNALEAARGRVNLNIDTKHRRDLEAVGDLVLEMGMQDQVLIKMTIDPADPDLTIREAKWFRDLTFMPVMVDPRPGLMAKDAADLVQLFAASMLEISFLSLEELDETSERMDQLGVRLWCNTLDPVHPLSYSDANALKNPGEVWGTLMRHGIGAIQTDQTEALCQYVGRKKH